MVPYKAVDKVHPAELEHVRLEGPIAQQLDFLIRERITSDFAKQTIYQETENALRERVDDAEIIIGRWKGEFWGKWIISACRVCRYLNDPSLKSFIHKAALNVISTADPDGYIGSYADPKNIFSPSPDATIPILGWHCKWNWNVWCRKYILWGLLECYELTGDKKILEAAKRSTDQLINMLHEMGVSIRHVGTFNGIPAASSIKPLLILYRHTHETRYLDFVLEIVKEWERKDGAIPNLISNALSGKPIHTWYPKSETWAKAYETMSCLDGLLELYRVTGDTVYLETAKSMHSLLLRYERTTLFSVGFNDIFANGKEYINTLTEPCDVIHWMRLCGELFRLTGDAEYMDDFELAWLNPLQAATYSDGKWGARGVRSSGHHMTAIWQANMAYSHCCVNNLPRGWMNACEMQVMSNIDGIYLNMFTEFTGTVQGKNGSVTVSFGGGYLRDHRLVVNVKTNGDEILNIRTPGWCRQLVIRVGDSVYKSTNTSAFFTLSVPMGTIRMELTFECEPAIHEFHRDPEHFSPDDFRLRRFHTDEDGERVYKDATVPKLGVINILVGCQKRILPEKVLAWNRRAWIQYGPLLLARSKRIGNTEEEMFNKETICSKGYSCTVEPYSSSSVRYAFHVHFSNGINSFDTNMCDFATGTNEWSKDDPCLFNLYI